MQSTRLNAKVSWLQLTSVYVCVCVHMHVCVRVYMHVYVCVLFEAHIGH